MIIAIDIDDTITAMPKFFAILSRAVIQEQGKVIIVSSRTNTPEVVRATEKELKEFGLVYSRLVMIEGKDTSAATCPHEELDWWNKYLWQKVDVCQREGVEVVIEDDEKVVALFRKYAPEIKVLRVVK
jgi:uncharacterized protein YhfF